MSKHLHSLAILTILGCALNASAQYSRAPSNPYGQSTGGGTITPYSQYRGNNNNNQGGIIIAPLYPFGPPVIAVSTPNGSFVAPYNPYVPTYLPSSVYSSSSSTTNPVLNGGYKTSGSTGSYSNYNRSWVSPSSSYIPPPAVEAPRKAFDRFAQQIDQNGQPDVRQNNDELDRALTAPTQTEIASGAALNAILDGLKPFLAKLKEMQAAPLEEDVLKNILFTRGSANEGVLRQEGKLEWPALLLNLTPKEFAAKIRLEIDKRFRDAYNQVRDGGLANEENLKQLTQRIDQMEGLAADQSQTMTFTQNVDVKRYLKGLDDAVAFLKKPDAANWLPGKPAQAKTLPELALAMNEKGMRFAPASTGREGDYAHLHRILADLFQQLRGGVGAVRK